MTAAPARFFVAVISYSFDRFGNGVDYFAETFFDTDCMKEAFAACRSEGGRLQAVTTNIGGKKFVVRRAPLNGVVDVRATYATDNLGLIDLYAATVGQEVFERQLADESFSINLDQWFDGIVPPFGA